MSKLLNKAHISIIQDAEGYELLAKKLSHKCLLFSRTPTAHTGNILQLNNTVSDTIKQLQSTDMSATILEAATHEEGETIVADLAIASGCGFVMFGGLRGMRVRLYNELLRMEQMNAVTRPALTSWGFKDLVEEEAKGDES